MAQRSHTRLQRAAHRAQAYLSSFCLQAVYSTGCAPTADELTAALADVAEEDGSLTKKAFKSLIVQMQRSIPREQDVLADVETLRG